MNSRNMFGVVITRTQFTIHFQDSENGSSAKLSLPFDDTKINMVHSKETCKILLVLKSTKTIRT